MSQYRLNGLKMDSTEKSPTDIDVVKEMTQKRTIIIGRTGSGKSSLGNTLLSRKQFTTGLSPKSITKTCQEATYTRAGQTYRVTDTPGLFDSTLSVTETMKELKKCCAMISPGPHIVLFVMRIGQCFEEETLKSFLEYFGDGVLEHTVIVFTGLDILKSQQITLDQYLSKSNSYLKDIVRKYKYTAVDSRTVSHDSALRLLEMIQSLMTENGGKCYRNEQMDFLKTTNENRTHSLNADAVLNDRMNKVVSIINSWKVDYENEQKGISDIETILEYPVSKRTRSKNWLVEGEKLLNGENCQEVLERLPAALRIQLMEIYDKENIGIKRSRGHLRDVSPATRNIVKRSRHTQPI